jgi:crotonobetainyl-CoA:carnitine CoA-transferase CaiB-like acyl-CoA transferase
MGEPTIEAAPASAAHTREICTTLLGLTDAEIDALIEAGVLEAPL